MLSIQIIMCFLFPMGYKGIQNYSDMPNKHAVQKLDPSHPQGLSFYG